MFDATVIAYSVINNQSATMEGHARLIAAAAVQALADQVVPEGRRWTKPEYFSDDMENYEQEKRDEILAIAAELQPGHNSSSTPSIED